MAATDNIAWSQQRCALSFRHSLGAEKQSEKKKTKKRQTDWTRCSYVYSYLNPYSSNHTSWVLRIWIQETW